MLPKTRSSHLLLLAAAVALGALSWACHDEPTAPSISARAGGGSGGPSVRSVDPDSAPQDTTLDVHVFGSGFDSTSRVRFALHGDTLRAKIRTNSTRFVSKSELVANITVAADALPDKYDVNVYLSQGKPGIGTEMFTVTVVMLELGDLGGDGCEALAINQIGQVVGWSCTASGEEHAFFYSESGGTGHMEDLGVLPGHNWSHASGINNLGQVVGNSGIKDYSVCCSGPTFQRPVVWERPPGGVWSVRELPSVSSARANDINDAGYVVGWDGGAVIWSPSGAIEPLPLLTGTTQPYVSRINNTGQAVGYVWSTTLTDATAVLWYRDGSGDWSVMSLGYLPGGAFSVGYDLTDRDGSGRMYVVGDAKGGSTNVIYTHGVRWTLLETSPAVWQVVAMEELAKPTGDSRRFARAVNASGAVTGYAGPKKGSPWWVAVRWFAATTLGEILPQPTNSSNYGRDINDAGWIVGRAGGRAVMWREQ